MELVPTPPSFSGKWKEYFQTLNQVIYRNGWVFVSMSGYPFYSYDNNVELGDKGLNAFLLPLNAKANVAKPFNS